MEDSPETSYQKEFQQYHQFPIHQEKYIANS